MAAALLTLRSEGRVVAHSAGSSAGGQARFGRDRGTRREDWRVGDPTGAPLDEVRRVRDDIDERVQALLAELEADAT